VSNTLIKHLNEAKQAIKRRKRRKKGASYLIDVFGGLGGRLHEVQAVLLGKGLALRSSHLRIRSFAQMITDKQQQQQQQQQTNKQTNKQTN
jgi:hypothetical protein